MTSGLITALLVAARIAATSWANVVQKRLLSPGSMSPLRLVVGVWGWMTLLSLPWWIGACNASYAFWFWMLITCALEVPGNVLLLRSLQQTELSIFGPLSSVKPVISLLLALVLFGETPSGMGALGVAIVVLGTLSLTSERRSPAEAVQSRQRRAGIRDRLLAVLLTATASVFLKQAMTNESESRVLAVWCVTSWLLAIGWQVLARLAGQPRSATAVDALPQATGSVEHAAGNYAADRRGQRAVFIVSLAMLAMQGCTIALFARMPVGYALALFQIGSLVSVILGHRLFGEAHLLRRLVAASVMVVGACVIIIAG
jgi:drug/metabolite transporter (DMT)-like permease